MQLSVSKTSSARVDAEFDDDSGMFDVAPVSLWLEDYSELKNMLDEWRQAGVTDLRAYLLEDPPESRRALRGCASSK